MASQQNQSLPDQPQEPPFSPGTRHHRDQPQDSQRRDQQRPPWHAALAGEGAVGRLRGLAERDQFDSAVLAEVIEYLPVGVYYGTFEDGITLCNRVGLEMLGVSSLEELRQSVPRLGELIETRWAGGERAGERLRPEEETFVRALRGETCTGEVVYTHVATGRQMVVRCSAAPVVRGGRVVAAVAVNTDITDTFRVAALQASEAERERLLREREGLLAQERARAEREALLNQIGAAVRSTGDPEEVQSRAVALLGEALGLDLCHAASFDAARDAWHVAPDWHRPDLPSLAGDYPMRVWRALSDEVVRDGATATAAAFRDVMDSPALSDETRALFARMNVRAFVNVSSFDATGTPVTGLSAAMSDGPRDWTPEEVGLIEAVATLVRTASESARLQLRERTIAQTLQAALQPEVPPQVPGMALQGFYRATLEEAEVGGDFMDVFPVEGGVLTCLVCGDLSGKGLAAASQVASVRNMLRYALHSDGPLAAAVTKLNGVLAEQDILTGFATLFAGVFDAEARALSYVNCGQEPALVWRAATGAVEFLPPTGPVLGGFDGGTFEEATASLGPGDVLALVTDGMTEVGVNRRGFLEIDGLAALFARCCSEEATTARLPSEVAASVVRCLVSGVEAQAGGAAGIRDDIALLVGVVGTGVGTDALAAGS